MIGPIYNFDFLGENFNYFYDEREKKNEKKRKKCESLYESKLRSVLGLGEREGKKCGGNLTLRLGCVGYDVIIKS